MAFDEVQFPPRISYGSTGGPERLTDIVTLRSGAEQRNSIWADSRRRYDASLGLDTLDDLHTIIGFFEARMGQLRGFRWKDWTDYKSCAPTQQTTSADQTLGVGNAVNKDFQLIKTYTSGSQNWIRQIKKPVSGTVKVEVDGVLQTETTHYTVNYATGLITFVTAPASTKIVKAGFEFDVPARFATDYINISVDAFESGSIASIEILEIKV